MGVSAVLVGLGRPCSGMAAKRSVQVCLPRYEVVPPEGVAAAVVEDVGAVVHEAVAAFLPVVGDVLGGADVGHEKREHGEFALLVV